MVAWCVMGILIRHALKLGMFGKEMPVSAKPAVKTIKFTVRKSFNNLVAEGS